ncbi:alpha/beta fold hydrolase [Rhodococcus chondri]|uniref:Alpha/beta hydrolase n=1 Tax=Rhodococcus chondri TaxID=3065941 RepID=A0ABU7JVF4_9NOCA|nr:alpha/beta hydrolase [Rhodococcus sp. CC-R104]MEE2034009.1 alpha/beta hydrolase [Rhodococcus sp. CC-R104]
MDSTDFATTAEGVAFYRAYDRVLAKWPVETTRVDLASQYGTTRVNSCGPSGAPPVILLPGGGATSAVWFANVATLAEGYHVYAVDLMGDVGRSVPSGTPLRTVDDLMSWLDTVVDAIGETGLRLVGHSYGAMIALAYALRAPERVRTLTLLDPNSCFAGMRAPYLARAVPLLLRPTEQRQRNFIRWETGNRHVDPEWLDLLALGAATFPASKTIVPKRPKRTALQNLAVETTVVLAAESKVHDSRRLAAHITESFPQIGTVVVEEASHHGMPMQPAQALNDVLRQSL